MSETQRQKYLEAIDKLPPWNCGRIDMDTYIPTPVEVGRVKSDQVRYIYFDDKVECVVVGPRCDHMAFAAGEYRTMQATITALRAEVERLTESLRELQERYDKAAAHAMFMDDMEKVRQAKIRREQQEGDWG